MTLISFRSAPVARIPPLKTHPQRSQQAPLIVCTLLITVPETVAGVDSHRHLSPKLPSYCVHLKSVIDENAAAATAAAAAAAAADALALLSNGSDGSVAEPDEARTHTPHAAQLHRQSSMQTNDVLVVRSIEITDRSARDTSPRAAASATTESAPPAETSMFTDDGYAGAHADDASLISDADDDDDSSIDSRPSSIDPAPMCGGIRLNLDGYEMDRFGHLPGESRTPTPRKLVGAWMADQRQQRRSSPSASSARQVIRVTVNNHTGHQSIYHPPHHYRHNPNHNRSSINDNSSSNGTMIRFQ